MHIKGPNMDYYGLFGLFLGLNGLILFYALHTQQFLITFCIRQQFYSLF